MKSCGQSTHAEDVELARAEVEQHRLAAVPRAATAGRRTRSASARRSAQRQRANQPVHRARIDLLRASRTATDSPSARLRATIGIDFGALAIVSRRRTVSSLRMHVRAVAARPPATLGSTGPRRRRPARGSAPSSSVSLCAGMRVWLVAAPLVIVCMIAGSPPAVQPDVVGQVGRAERRVALAVGAVAGGAGRLNFGLPSCARDRVVRAARQATARSWRRSSTSSACRRAAAIGGIMPLRPSVIVSDLVRRRRRTASRCRSGWGSPCCRARRSRGTARSC